MNDGPYYMQGGQNRQKLSIMTIFAIFDHFGGPKITRKEEKRQTWLYSLILTVLNYLGSGHNLSDGGG